MVFRVGLFACFEVKNVVCVISQVEIGQCINKGSNHCNGDLLLGKQ